MILSLLKRTRLALGSGRELVIFSLMYVISKKRGGVRNYSLQKLLIPAHCLKRRFFKRVNHKLTNFLYIFAQTRKSYISLVAIVVKCMEYINHI